jgi:hypothetical protein
MANYDVAIETTEAVRTLRLCKFGNETILKLK